MLLKTGITLHYSIDFWSASYHHFCI